MTTPTKQRKKQETYADWFKPFVTIEGTTLFYLYEDKGYQAFGLVKNGKAWDIHITPKGNKVRVRRVR